MKKRATFTDYILRSVKKPVWYSLYRLTGYRLAMPAHFFKLAMFGGIFRAPIARLQNQLPGEPFTPMIDQAGFGRIAMIAIDYREADIVYPYREFAVTVLGNIPGRSGDIHYYLHLPVTTEEARWTGVEIYGFPKYLAKIDLAEAEDQLSCVLMKDGELILKIIVRRTEPVEKEWLAQNLTFRSGKPFLNEFRTHGLRGEVEQAGGACLEFGNHPIGLALHGLEIDPVSISHFTCPEIQATLSKPMPY